MQQESTETQSTKPSDGQGAKSTSTTKPKARKRKAPTKKKAAPKKEASKGLGDTIQKVTEATKLDKLAKLIAGDDCGCEERRKKLNALFPYAQPMTDESKEKWETVLQPAWDRQTLKRPEQLVLTQVYEQVFQVRRRFTTCGSCLVTALKKLKKAYDNSCKDES